MNNEIKRENVPEKKAPKKPEAEILLDRQLEMKDKTKVTNIITVISFCALILVFGVLFIILPDNQYSETEKRTLTSVPDLSWFRITTDLQRDLKMMTMTDEEKSAYKDAANWNTISAELNEKIDRMNISDEEKAALKKKVTYSNYFTVLSDEVGDYYSDQFPLRDQLRVVKAATEMLMLKQENNGVLFANGYLVKKDTVSGTVKGEDGAFRDRTPEDAVKTIRNNVEYISMIQNLLPENVTLVTAVAGRTVDVTESILPAIFPYSSTNAESYWKAYSEAAAEKGLNTAELKDMLKTKLEAGEYVYYKTDHHWTSLGAYYAYAAIIEKFGGTALPAEDFRRETFSKNFIGTTYAKAGAALGGSDTIEFFRYDGDESYTTEIKDGGGTKLKAFYNYKYQDVMDKYSAFLGSDDMSNGGNNAVTLITKSTDQPRRKMIVFKDSFGHSLAPFLAIDYDLIVIDLRYYNGDLSEFLSDESLSAMLIIYNMETFENDSNIAKALAGVMNYYSK